MDKPQEIKCGGCGAVKQTNNSPYEPQPEPWGYFSRGDCQHADLCPDCAVVIAAELQDRRNECETRDSLAKIAKLLMKQTEGSPISRGECGPG